MIIIIGFSKATCPFKIGSWLIRKYLGTNYSHVFLKFKSTKFDRDLVYEAVGSGVRFVGKIEWEKHATVTDEYVIEIEEHDYIKLMQYCIDMSGQPYGILQNIGLVLAKALGLKSNPFKRGINCSELITNILIQNGRSVSFNPNLSTPKDIENLLKESLLSSKI